MWDKEKATYTFDIPVESLKESLLSCQKRMEVLKLRALYSLINNKWITLNEIRIIMLKDMIRSELEMCFGVEYNNKEDGSSFITYKIYKKKVKVTIHNVKDLRQYRMI